MDDPDAEILGRIARGDREAFGEFFDRHAAAATRYAVRLVGDRGAGEDAVSAAFVRLIGAARTRRIDPARGTLRGLLFRTVRNLCIDWMRARRSDAPLSSVEPASRAPSGDVRDAIDAAMMHLPEAHRSALLLRVDGGLTYAEIGAALGATLPQVKNWIFRARRAIADRLGIPLRIEEAGRAV